MKKGRAVFTPEGVDVQDQNHSDLGTLRAKKADVDSVTTGLVRGRTSDAGWIGFPDGGVGVHHGPTSAPGVITAERADVAGVNTRWVGNHDTVCRPSSRSGSSFAVVVRSRSRNRIACPTPPGRSTRSGGPGQLTAPEWRTAAATPPRDQVGPGRKCTWAAPRAAPTPRSGRNRWAPVLLFARFPPLIPGRHSVRQGDCSAPVMKRPAPGEYLYGGQRTELKDPHDMATRPFPRCIACLGARAEPDLRTASPPPSRDASTAPTTARPSPTPP